MNELQSSILLYIVAVLARIPRIKERWTAPLMRADEWFFDVAVPPDFLAGPGAAWLGNYRWRLFLPWAIEGLLLAALLSAGAATILNLAFLISAGPGSLDNRKDQLLCFEDSRLLCVY